MKSKGGSLYEVLKSASRTPGADDASAPAPDNSAASPSEAQQQATLQERLAAYKAAKLAAANSGTAIVEAAPARPAAATLVLEPDPTPIPAPAPAPTRLMVPAPAPAAAVTTVQAPVEDTPLPAPAKGPGERVVRLTYNTALFSGMIVVGLLFIAYAIGLHKGKASIPAEAAPAPAAKATPIDITTPPPPRQVPVPAAPRKEYTIRLGEWKYVSAQDRVRALALADDPELKKQLERSGHRLFEKAFITRNAEVKMALYVDRFSDLNSEAAKAALTAMKTFRFKNATPFAQAAFEEKPQ